MKIHKSLENHPPGTKQKTTERRVENSTQTRKRLPAARLSHHRHPLGEQVCWAHLSTGSWCPDLVWPCAGHVGTPRTQRTGAGPAPTGRKSWWGGRSGPDHGAASTGHALEGTRASLRPERRGGAGPPRALGWRGSERQGPGQGGAACRGPGAAVGTTLKRGAWNLPLSG